MALIAYIFILILHVCMFILNNFRFFYCMYVGNTGARGVIKILNEKTQSPTFCVQFRGNDDNLGTVDHIPITNTFAGYTFASESQGLLDEMKKLNTKKQVLTASTIAADYTFFVEILNIGGPFRIVSALMAVIPLVALLNTFYLLKEFVILKLETGNVFSILKSYFFGSMCLSAMGNITRFLVFVDPLGTQGIFVYELVRPLLSFQVTLYIMESVFTIFQLVDILASVKASLKFTMHSVSFLEKSASRISLFTICLGLIVCDLYVAIFSTYGILGDGVIQLPSMIFSLLLLLLSIFSIRVSIMCWFFSMKIIYHHL